MSTDPLHGISSNDAYFFPKMKKGSGVFKHFGGPASRHGDMAMKGGQRYFQYQLKDPKWSNYDVAGEMGIVAVNHLVFLKSFDPIAWIFLIIGFSMVIGGILFLIFGINMGFLICPLLLIIRYFFDFLFNH